MTLLNKENRALRLEAITLRSKLSKKESRITELELGLSTAILALKAQGFPGLAKDLEKIVLKPEGT